MSSAEEGMKLVGTQSREVWICVVIVVLLNLVAYGLWVGSLGLYVDDWTRFIPAVSSTNNLLPTFPTFFERVSTNRPFKALII